jgi:hypothetical protein
MKNNNFLIYLEFILELNRRELIDKLAIMKLKNIKDSVFLYFIKFDEVEIMAIII